VLDPKDRVQSAKDKLKKGDLVIVEWVDITTGLLEWTEVANADTAQIRSCGFVHSYDGKNLVLSRDLDPVDGNDATPTVLPMGPFINVVMSCQRVLRRGREEVWDCEPQGIHERQRADPAIG